jgi:prevent-host-death family protein
MHRMRITMNRISITEARNHLAHYIRQVMSTKGPVIIERKGEPSAAIISLEDLKQYEAFLREREETDDREAVRQARHEIAEHGTQSLDDFENMLND